MSLHSKKPDDIIIKIDLIYESCISSITQFIETEVIYMDAI